jgi:hypothetical protein
MQGLRPPYTGDLERMKFRGLRRQPVFLICHRSADSELLGDRTAEPVDIWRIWLGISRIVVELAYRPSQLR